MTDRSAFERLALHVLRSADPACKAVLALGTNDKGETVVSPLDGFALAEDGQNPLFVTVESTTTDPKGLKKKWLFDHKNPPSAQKTPNQKATASGKKKSTKTSTLADDGDLLKAAREATRLAANHAGARFRVYLATNQKVTADLRVEVDATAKRLGVECEIWEQSRISDFLDIEPTGQFLRSKYFGTGAERISNALLLEVGQDLLRDYAQYARVEVDPSKWIDRGLDAELDELLADPIVSLVLVVGHSGFGKTVACYRTLTRLRARSCPALWLSAEMIESAHSLNEAIDSAIRQRVPTLLEFSLRSLSGALSPGQSLVVSVDDVSRARQPAVLIRRLCAWAATSPNVTLLCPIWPRLINSEDISRRIDVRQVRVGEFTDSEATTALVSKQRVRTAAVLGNDPFLIGLANQIFESGGTVDEAQSSREILDRFVDRQLVAMQAGECGKPILSEKAEHQEAISAIAENSLRHAQLSPTLASVKSWLKEERTRDAAREVFSCSGIVRIAQSDQRLQYRHDRLRDHLLASALSGWLDREPTASAFTEPFFSEVSATALVQMGTPDHLVAIAEEAQPLLLAKALSIVPAGSDEEKRVLGALLRRIERENAVSLRVRTRFSFRGKDEISSVRVVGSFNGWSVAADGCELSKSEKGDLWEVTLWLPPKRHEYKFLVNGSRWIGGRPTDGVPDGFGGFNATADLTGSQSVSVPQYQTDLAFLIGSELSRLDAPAVAAAARALKLGRETPLFARLRNGDAEAGVLYCGWPSADPTTSYFARTEAFLTARANHGAVIANEFRALPLEGEDDRKRLAAIIFAGHMQHAEMIRHAFTVWKTASAPKRLLPQMLWCQLQSPRDDFDALGILFEVAQELDDARPENGMGELGSLLEFLRLTRYRHRPSTIKWLIAKSHEHERFGEIAWTLLKTVDDPDAVAFIVRTAANWHTEAKARGNHWLGGFQLGEAWDRGDTGLTEGSLDVLHALWSDSAQSSETRWAAFTIWRKGIRRTEKAISRLRQVSTSSPFFQQSVCARAVLADMTVEGTIAKMLGSLGFDAYCAARVWGPEIEKAVRNILQSADEDSRYGLARLLLFAPSSEAARILVDTWDELSTDRHFVEVAVLIGGEELDPMAASAIEDWQDDDTHPLRFIVMHLETSYPGGFQPNVTKDAIGRIVRYHKHLRDFDLQRLGEMSRKYGFGGWGRRKIGPLLEESSRGRVFPEPHHIMAELSSFLTGDGPHLNHPGSWAEEVKERADGTFDLLDVLDDWLEENPDARALNCAAEVITTLGRRRGLDILSSHSDSKNPDHVARLRGTSFTVRRYSLD